MRMPAFAPSPRTKLWQRPAYWRCSLAPIFWRTASNPFRTNRGRRIQPRRGCITAAASPFEAPHYPLPADKARFVGEAVAMVIGETLDAAKDGAERLAIDYEVLPAVVETAAAARQDAPLVHERMHDDTRSGAHSNVCFDAEIGDAAATAAAFARAAHVTRFECWVQRVTGVPMEPRAALADYDAASGRVTLYAGNGGAVRLKTDLAVILDVPPEKVRVLMADIGGNFGTRGMIYPEFAAGRLGGAQARPPGEMGDRAP